MLGWRDTPIDGDAIGRVARASQPYIEQIFVGRAAGHDRGRSSSASSTSCASAPKRKSPSPTSRTRTSSTSRRSPRAPSSTKACCWRRRSPTSIRELSDPDVVSALCLVHQRFSHQHVSHLAARASVPLHRAQRRDQHAARQRELDARAPVDAGVAAVRRRYQEAVSRSFTPGGSDSAALRQRGRAAGACPAAACRTSWRC